MLCVNMDGEFEKILVIGKYGKPRCFKSIDTRTLPVTWEIARCEDKMPSSTTPGQWSKLSKERECGKRETCVFTSQYDIHASTTRSGNNQGCQNNLLKTTSAVCVG